jgi:serine/threonine protein kinase
MPPPLLSEAELAATLPISGITAVAHAGGGANGTVYRVDASDGVHAIKVVSPALRRERLERELLALRRVASPHVVAYRGHGTIRSGGVDYPFVDMAWVEGPTLDSWVGSSAPPTFDERVEIICQLLEAVDALGGQGVTHRDIKPANIIVGTHGAVLVDLGWARVESLATITAPGQPTGTYAYNAPEQLRHDAVDTRSDLFSVGIVAFELLTGTHPFVEDDGTGPALNFSALLAGRPIGGLLASPDISDDLAAVLETLLAAAPALRPRTGAIAADEVRHARVSSRPPMPVFPRAAFLAYQGNRKSHLRSGFAGLADVDGVVLELRVNSGTTAVVDLLRFGPHRLVDPSSNLSPLAASDQSPIYRRHGLPSEVVAGDLLSGGNLEAFVRSFVGRQVQLGATAIVSPYLHADPGRKDVIELAARAAEVAKTLAAGRPVLAGVAMDGAVVSDDVSRRDLLNTLTGTTVEGFFFLVADGRSDFRQTDGVGLLSGLREVIEVLTRNRQAPFFARCGSVGLALVAMGAAGFATGIEAKNLHYVPTDPTASEGGQQPLPRFYERTLLGFLREPEARLARLRIDPSTGQQALAPCSCAFCGAAPDQMRVGAAWDSDASLRHFLSALADDLQELRVRRLPARRAWLDERLTLATSARERLSRAGVVLQPDSQSPAIQAWRDAFLS